MCPSVAVRNEVVALGADAVAPPSRVRSAVVGDARAARVPPREECIAWGTLDGWEGQCSRSTFSSLPPLVGCTGNSAAAASNTEVNFFSWSSLARRSFSRNAAIRFFAAVTPDVWSGIPSPVVVRSPCPPDRDRSFRIPLALLAREGEGPLTMAAGLPVTESKAPRSVEDPESGNAGPLPSLPFEAATGDDA